MLKPAGKPRGAAAPFTKEEVRKMKQLVAANPAANCKWVADQIGRSKASTQVHANRNGIFFPKRNGRLPVLAPGLPGKLMSDLEKNGLTNIEICNDLQIAVTTYARYRRGNHPTPFFVVEILAELAGYEIVLRKKGVADAKGENELASTAVEAGGGAGSAGIQKATKGTRTFRR